ncbi:MAG: Asp-tRNA(Asn)/Glu-tRNA(Gln) amidotransferase subunit GatA [Planctomycetota bacterium]|nr:Asp-tRNA(Asn)/Glu-tRNA(Gln) amidotransferase subunit GatA [Planctomycetota bacterium]
MSQRPQALPESADEIARAVSAGQALAADVLERSLQRIAALDGRVKAFVEVFHDAARHSAQALDAARAGGAELGPLAGVPVAIKDNFVMRDQRTSCGSAILEGFVSPYTASAVERLVSAGAIIVGRTNMDEFAMGSSTEHSCHGPTHNPFDLQRIPGGSSGGSAAAVAARMVPLALGSDTGGSVRQPAALCGVSGLKPTYGRISRFGLVAFASSLDTVSPFACDATDLALCLRVLAGVDTRDATSINAPVPDYLAADAPGIEGLRIGVPTEYFADGLDPEVEARTREALAILEIQGATLVELAMPHTRFAIPTYYLIATAEASSNLARYDGIRYGRRAEHPADDLNEMYTATRHEGFGAEVQRRILLGSFCLRQGYVEEWYQKAQKVRTLIRRDFDAAFSQVDLIASATSPGAAFSLGEKLDDPLAMYMNDILTTPANLAGVPGLSIPCGFTDEDLPVGLQLMGQALDEATLLRTAAVFQEATDYHRREPVL